VHSHQPSRVDRCSRVHTGFLPTHRVPDEPEKRPSPKRGRDEIKRTGGRGSVAKRLRARRAALKRDASSTSSTTNNLMAITNVDKYLLNVPPAGKDIIPCTLPGGERYFVVRRTVAPPLTQEQLGACRHAMLASPSPLF